MRILFVDPSGFPSYGGSKRVLVNILSRLDRARFEPFVLFCSIGPYVQEVADFGIWVSAPEELRRDPSRYSAYFPSLHGPGTQIGIERMEDGEIHRAPLRSLARDVRSELYYHIFDRRLAKRLRRFLPERVDLIHFNGPMQEHYEWAHLARLLRIPYITHEHGVWRQPPAAFRHVVHDAAAVLCLTEERARRIREFVGRSAPAEVLPNGVDIDKQRPRRTRAEVRAELGIDERTPLLITASHILEWKGQGLGVQVARILRDQGLEFRWLMCGSQTDKEFVRSLRRQIDDARLADHMLLVDQRDDVPDLFAASDLMVHTSIRPEPFGMVVIEAMCVGTPVVGPDEGAIPGILRDGIDGRIYPPRDAPALAATITSLLADPATRSRLGAAARTRVLESFSLSSQVSRLSEIYESAVSAARSDRQPAGD